MTSRQDLYDSTTAKLQVTSLSNFIMANVFLVAA